MTTAQRAASLYGHEKPATLRSAFPKKPNSFHRFESIKGLKIQSFFYDLVAGVGDINGMLDDMNPYMGQAAQDDYDRIVGVLRQVGQAFMNAGYSVQGNPYWAERTGPNDHQIGQIIDAAEGCLPILQELGLILRKNSGQGEKDRRAFDQFVERFSKFNGAITGFKDHIRLRQYDRRRVHAGQDVVMCALA